MKVKFEIELELPDEFKYFNRREIEHELYTHYADFTSNSYMQNAIFYHMIMDLDMEERKKHVSEPSDEINQMMYEHHQKWETICRTAKLTIGEVS